MKEFVEKKPIRVQKNFESKLSTRDKERVPDFLLSVLGFKSLEELNSLKNRIAKAHGVIRIFVHSFYDEMRNKNVSFESIKKGVMRHAASKGNVPIIFFEEDGKKDERLNGQLTIPTVQGGGVLSEDYLDEKLGGFDFFATIKAKEKARKVKLMESLRKQLEKELSPDIREIFEDEKTRLENEVNSDKIMNREQVELMFYYLLFKNLGVKKAVVGGMYFDDSPSGLFGCMGWVVERLKVTGIGVTLSRYHMDFMKKNVHGEAVN